MLEVGVAFVAEIGLLIVGGVHGFVVEHVLL